MAQSIVTCSPDILSGTPVFTGTRVPVQALIDYLEGGETIDRVTRFIEPPIRSARPDPAVTGALAQRKAWRGHMDRHLNPRSSRQPPGASDDDGEPLTQAQVRELRRRAADLDDPARYLLVSQFRPRFALYYNVSDDVYAMNDPRSATLFKRRRAALAVKQLLGPGIQILHCTTKLDNGVRVPILGKRLRSKGTRAK